MAYIMTHYEVARVLEEMLSDGLYNLGEHREISKHEELAIEKAIAIVKNASCYQSKLKRLTEWRGEHAAVVDNHANYIDRLAYYEDLDEAGRILTDRLVLKMADANTKTAQRETELLRVINKLANE